jgi:cell division septation protein DedD
MTRMAHTDDHDEVDQPRSILSAMWFRAVLVVVVLGVVALLAVPHVLDMVNAPPPRQSASVKLAPSPAMPPAVQPTPAPSPERAMSPQQTMPTPPPQPQPTEMAKATETPPAKPMEEQATKPMKSGPAEAVGKVVDGQSGDKPSRGTYWVQVGAFRDAAAAQKLAERLRAENYSVTETVKRGGPAPKAPAGGEAGDRYNVFVSGLAPTELTTRLSAKGLGADVVAGGAVIKPSLSLREAVALSRDLTADGLQVQVRRAGRTEGASAASPAPASGDGYHRVRVGGFSDRAAAVAVAKELEGKGYRPYIARGAQ